MRIGVNAMVKRTGLFRNVLSGLFVSVLISLLAIVTSASIAVANDTSRIIAVGDVHGDYDAYIEVLTEAGVIDDRLR